MMITTNKLSGAQYIEFADFMKPICKKCAVEKFNWTVVDYVRNPETGYQLKLENKKD